MSFLRIDGYPIDVLVDDFDIEDISVESYSRGAFTDSLEGLSYSKKKRLSFETPPLSIEEAAALEGWVRGEGHRWSFSRVLTPGGGTATVTFNRSSADSGYAFTGASIFSSAVSPLWANQAFSLGLVPGATATATVLFGSEGNWTLHGYHLSVSGSATWQPFVIKSYNGVVRSYTSGASVASIPYVAYTTASGFLSMQLQGETVTGTTATAQFAAVGMDRFAWTEKMILSAATPALGLASTGFTRRPFIVVTGDCLQGRYVACNGANEFGPVICKGYTESFSPQPVVVDNVFRYNARAVRVVLEEK
jgi:hypothetical protein